MTATVTLCIMAMCCAAAQLAIGVVAAVNDKARSETGELSRDRQYLSYDIYYERNGPFVYLYPHFCSRSRDAFNWVSRCINPLTPMLPYGYTTAIKYHVRCQTGLSRHLSK